MPVPPEAVWEALADSRAYGYWVVGSKVIRDADPHWPEPGSKIHHTVGVGPLELSDHTEVLEAERPRRLQLRAKGRPLGSARVTLELTPKDGGTVVRMTENPDGAWRPLAFLPPLQVFSLLRNAESLMRLEELALRRARDGGARGRAQAPATA
jgi:uncharacterized protein YndB with AHSA1/START domain